MTAQEQELIDGLVERVKSAPVQDRDDEADRYLHSKLDSIPDALYVLAQTVLVQQYGLNNAQAQLQDAQAQIEDLQEQLQQAQDAAQHPKSGSFLGKLLGTDPPPRYQPANTGYAAPPPPGYGYGQPAGYGYGAPPVAGGGGGFLRGALQTAAGVAAGEMMFEGMESLFRGFGGEHERLSGGGPTEVINNNYYEETRGGASEHHSADTGDSGGFYDPAHDASRQEDGHARDFLDTSSNDDNYDDGDDGSNIDDSGSYDDGGSSDDGGF